jgi:LacI family repressor for deo operon, udp, cdd, tsx, nupC, and nupG
MSASARGVGEPGWPALQREERLAHGKVTITDVAREAGVSIATVSRVIGDRASVSPELTDRVRAVAERLGYRPNLLARGLATGETGMVGVLVPQLRSPYFQEVIKAVGVGAAQEGYQMLVLESDDRSEAEAELAASLYAHVDGVILCSPRMCEDDLQSLAAGRPRLLCLNRLPAGPSPAAIAHDVHASMLQICRLVHSLGHRRVAFLAGDLQSWAGCQRWRAVQEAVAFGLDPVQVAAGAALSDGYAAVDAALACGPTALMGTSDPTALGALTRLQELGLRVPEDISVTGFGDIPFSRYANPSLTTLSVQRLDLGAHAWAMMRSLMAGEPAVAPPLLPGEVVVRASTGPVPDGATGPAAR